ncbi:bifunctional GNAT family N-acetyltransferase/carbon-nitrogen hydrolase family protein [Sediminicurvatus halobius]|uniref:Hydrolase n=1 Tax=Sediminicurvatus halobius TaxID=2182432 RepID=A0A2U2MZJ8_9GAMM|nr:bifunctional GNAT family N-acetyltransferase/carbon-nitrogen hydrolase family protein [Spiribacter halobius]PWG62154.1 hydrolase [Spiribacter halobius]UEX77159.1 GNAT family N-acetyltransferase [Spiribacter halobius]
MTQPDLTGEEHHLNLRNLRLADYDDVRSIMDRVYRGLGGAWTRKQFAAQINRFPEGQICIEDNGRVVAAAISMIVDYDRFGDRHKYDEIVGNGYLTNHDPNGDVLYGVDVFVDPDYRGMRLGRRLYDARKELCRSLNLRAIVAGGRMPGYEEYAAEKKPEEYIELVKRREVYDPILSFQLANDFHVRRVITGYLPEDRESKAYATLLQWDNIFYENERTPLIGGRKSTVRVGTVQWQMRRVTNFEDLMNNIEFFVDAMAGYNCDFILFPEFFNAPLLAQFNQEDPAEAMRGLAQYTGEIVDAMTRLAVTYNINIIAGSMPLYEEQTLYNVAYLCRRDGTTDYHYKLHATPDERFYWGVQGGDQLKAFDTDVGRIGILVCYDVEFPEASRILADQGMQILFVPFWTDTKNAYLRVRRCAQARAIENECYVAITGSVGNLPKVENIEIQYAQAAVFSPSDFAFPHDGIVAESTPNTEMTLIVDLDMDKIKQLREEGSVRNAKDRRLDLYRVQWLDH